MEYYFWRCKPWVDDVVLLPYSILADADTLLRSLKWLSLSFQAGRSITTCWYARKITIDLCVGNGWEYAERTVGRCNALTLRLMRGSDARETGSMRSVSGVQSEVRCQNVWFQLCLQTCALSTTRHFTVHCWFLVSLRSSEVNDKSRSTVD